MTKLLVDTHCDVCDSFIHGHGPICSAHRGNFPNARLDARGYAMRAEIEFGDPRKIAERKLSPAEQAIVLARRKELAESKAREEANLKELLRKMGVANAKAEAARKANNAAFWQAKAALLASNSDVFDPIERGYLYQRDDIDLGMLQRLVSERRAARTAQAAVAVAMGITRPAAPSTLDAHDHCPELRYAQRKAG